jgi:hypothetical protein
MRILSILALAASAFAPALGHDFWLDAEPIRPEGAGPVTIRVRGGHYFPASAVALADRLIDSIVLEPDGAAPTRINTEAAGHERRGSVEIDAAPLHRVTLQIRQPRKPAPAAWARVFIVPHGAATNPEMYAAGAGLEIVPRAPLETIAVGTAVPFDVLRDGQPIAARIEFVAAAGGASWVEARPPQSAMFTPRKPGRHLALIRAGPQTATLVFEVAP